MESLFSNHLLQQKNLDPILRPVDSSFIWPSLYLIVCLIILVSIRQHSFTMLFKIVQSTFSFQNVQKAGRIDTNQFRNYSFNLILFFILNVAFLASYINIHYKLILTEQTFLIQYLFFIICIVLLLLYKLALNKLLVLITGSRKSITEFQMLSININQTAGLLLFPLMVLIAFSALIPQIIFFGAVFALAFTLVLKWVKGMLMGLVEERIGILQIFTYFCALEILPALVLVKYIIETF